MEETGTRTYAVKLGAPLQDELEAKLKKPLPPLPERPSILQQIGVTSSLLDDLEAGLDKLFTDIGPILNDRDSEEGVPYPGELAVNQSEALAAVQALSNKVLDLMLKVQVTRGRIEL